MPTLALKQPERTTADTYNPDADPDMVALRQAYDTQRRALESEESHYSQLLEETRKASHVDDLAGALLANPEAALEDDPSVSGRLQSLSQRIEARRIAARQELAKWEAARARKCAEFGRRFEAQEIEPLASEAYEHAKKFGEVMARIAQKSLPATNRGLSFNVPQKVDSWRTDWPDSALSLWLNDMRQRLGVGQDDTRRERAKSANAGSRK